MHEKPYKKYKISQYKLSHKIKIVMDFDVVKSVRCENKILALKIHYMVLQ